MLNILHTEQERKLLEERKNVALSACLEEERRLERLKGEIASLEGVIKLKTASSTQLDMDISLQNGVLSTLKNDIHASLEEKKQALAKKDQEHAEVNLRVAELMATRDGLQKDIDTLHRGINELRTEEGQTQERLKEQGLLLMSVIASVSEEQNKLTELIASQAGERADLLNTQARLQKTAEAQQKREEELYQLREDLTIISERYAEFARTHSLPFNI